MAKISTPKTSVKISEAQAEAMSAEDSFNYNEKPSAHIINNILNYSKALEVKHTADGALIENVMN